MVKVLFYFNEQQLLCDLRNGNPSLNAIPSSATLGSHNWVFINLTNLKHAEQQWRYVQQNAQIQEVYQYSPNPDRLEDEIMCRFITVNKVKGVTPIRYLYR